MAARAPGGDSMIAISLAELQRLALGELRVRSGAETVTGVEIDSRRVSEGDLFVAVGSGGASYVSDALERGAAAALLPADEHAALAALGRFARERLEARVVAITGSVGKTTTKDIAAALCKPHRETIAAEASYNNELGVPLTLCRADRDTEIVIAELGMRGLGQIAELCNIARPDIGVITSIGPAHLELVGSLEDVARCKAELLSQLPETGVAIVPAAEERLAGHMRTCEARTITVGPGGSVELVRSDEAQDKTNVQVNIEGVTVELTFNFRGRHNVENALMGIAVYSALDLPLSEIGAGAGRVAMSPLRSEEIALEGGGLLLNDSYNANPMSMAAALAHLSERAGSRRRVAVLGEMAELGAGAEVYHLEIGELLARERIDLLIGIGELAVQYRDGLSQAGGAAVVELVETTDDAIAALAENLEPGDCVLVKASRAVGLEVVAEAVETIVA